MGKDSTKVRGCLFGLAYGDALAAPTEFIKSVKVIEQKFGPGGPNDLVGDPALVTDDTQMTLAVGEALVAAQGKYTPDVLEPLLRNGFVTWMNSPDNDRAPGMTCMSACRQLERGVRWQLATVVGSKGCGANMRVALVGLLDVDTTTRAALAQFQAALTHGHPTGLTASDLTAFTIADLAHGGEPVTLTLRLREYALSQRTVYHADWLGDLWQRAGGTSPESCIERGWDECLEALDNLDKSLAAPDRAADPCLATGEGWVAEEAFATGLLCFLLFPDDPVQALRRASVTSGDSDSIACLAGAFSGAYHGISAWPAAWLERIEYRERLERIASQLAVAG